MEKEQEILAEAIKRNKSLYRVAQLVKVTYSTAHAWKTGKAHPQSRNLLKLMELAGKTIAIIGLIGASMIATTPDANAAKDEGVRLFVYYVKFKTWLKRVFYSFASMVYAG